MSARSGFPGRLTAWCLVVLACLSVFACSSSDEPTPEPSPSPPLNTIEASEVGDRLTVTASVADVPAGRSFVVRDVDLPDDGLLVLGESDVRVPALVTVVGTIERFTFDRFSDRYELTDAAAYRRFEGRKILVADDVRSWAGTESSQPPTRSS
jgi:hypothetical protein